MIAIIFASDLDNGIGKNGSIPWKLSEDMKFFKETTMGKICIFGRTTYEGLPRKLDGRECYVVSRDPSKVALHPGDKAFPTLASAIIAAESTGKDVCLCGGSDVYMVGEAFADVAHRTIVLGHFGCDKEFALSSALFETASTRTLTLKDSKNSHQAVLVSYSRKVPRKNIALGQAQLQKELP